VLTEKRNLLSRSAASTLPTHISDITALEGRHRDDYWITAVNAGFRTGLVVPLLKENLIVGIITLGRKQVQPFTDKQISLFRDFAAQATIALESTRRERQYREAQMALAHANRVATMGQLTASITHEVSQPVTAAVTYALAARRWLSADPPIGVGDECTAKSQHIRRARQALFQRSLREGGTWRDRREQQRKHSAPLCQSREMELPPSVLACYVRQRMGHP
jgi:signal transduction histidine kinase